MSVIAKFFVQEVTRRAYNPGACEVKLSAVSRGQDNKSWASATPVGNISMTILNESAAAAFLELGDEFYVTFEPAPKGQEG
jgi:hypothetical protein